MRTRFWVSVAREWLVRARNTILAVRDDVDLQDELRSHLELAAAADHHGETTDSSSTERLSTGGLSQAMDALRDQRGWPWLDAVAKDVRYAGRVLAKHPVFTAVCVLSLALGTGVNLAMFQLLDALRLRMLPVRAPEELVDIRLDDVSGARGAWLREGGLTNPLWEQIRRNHDGFSGVFAWADEDLDVSTTSDLHAASVLWVSGEFFPVLGVQPALGRLFGPIDDVRGCGRGVGVVLSYAYWQQAFGGEPSIIGRDVSIGHSRTMVIGVTEASFFGLEVGRTFDIALPICAEPGWHGVNARLDSGTVWWLTVMGRLAHGSSLKYASERLRAASHGIFSTTLPPGYPLTSVTPYLNATLVAAPAGRGVSRLRTMYARPLTLLLGIAGAGLLIGCVNLAVVMLARTNARRREFALRLSLGASRHRLIQQLTVETGLVAAGGAGIGLALATAFSRVLVSKVAAGQPGVFLDLSLDWRMFVAAVTVTVVTAFAFALIPVRRALTTPPAGSLQSRGNSITWDRDQSLVRRSLLVVQIALALLLLVSSALFVQTLRNLATVNAGLDPHGIVIADVNFGNLQPSDALVAIRHDLLEQLRAIPSVEAATEALIVPLTGGNWNNRMWLDGRDASDAQVVKRNMIGTDYFRTFRTRIVAGREFEDPDFGPSAAKVAVVNERFAEAFGVTGRAVGEHVWIEQTPLEPRVSYAIVGVVGNAKYHDLREVDPPTLYVPLWPAALRRPSGEFVLRAATGPESLIASVRPALNRVGPLRFAFRDYQEIVDNSLLRERLMATLALPFSMLAVLLTALGVYGVFSYSVAQRTHEIGIRVALGASRRAVMAGMFREALTVLAVGVTIGAVLVALTGRAVQGLLFGLASDDLRSLLFAVTLLATVAALGTYIPARRAATIDPAVTLRHD